jgi:hypothetical protein
MKLIIFIANRKFRVNTLNNFIGFHFIRKYLILNFSGVMLSLIGRLFIFFNIANGISCDGSPIILNKKKGINFWLGGSKYKIKDNYKNLVNNYFNISSVFTNHKKILQLYPLQILSNNNFNNPKIVFFSSVRSNKNTIAEDIWRHNKSILLNNHFLIEKESFWKKYKKKFKLSEQNFFSIYKIIKTKIRLELLEICSKTFKKNLILIGDDLIKAGYLANKNIFNKNDIKEIYNGNICLDFGSISGSLCLYPRSIQAIESGGLLLQSLQTDSKIILGSNLSKLTFNNTQDLLYKCDIFLRDKNLFNSYLEKIKTRFKNSENKIEKSLDKIFNK